jgi:quinol monooxygenase YgiN
MQDIMQLTRTVAAEEPECLGIEVLQDVDDPTLVTLVERWTSREVYEGPHMQTEHLQSFIARARDNFAGPPDISFWLTENAP